MNEMLQDDECLATQTQGCCEGGRRPAWPDRKSLTKEGVAHYYPNDPVPVCVMPVGKAEIERLEALRERVVQARNKAIADEVSEVIQEREASTDALLAERAKDYGPPEINMTGIGLIWTAQLRNHWGMPDLPVLSGQMVALMMAGLKLNRLAKSPNHQDSYDDADGYLEIARKRLPPTQTK